MITLNNKVKYKARVIMIKRYLCIPLPLFTFNVSLKNLTKKKVQDYQKGEL